jgi:hypothetical protein
MAKMRLHSVWNIFQVASLPDNDESRHIIIIKDPNIAVGIEAAYGLEGRGIGARAPVEVRFFSLPRRPDRLWGPSGLLPEGVWGVKLESDHSLPISAEVKNTWIYTSTPPIYLHSIVLNELSTGTILPYLDWFQSTFLIKKIKVGLCDHHAVCLCTHPINFWMLEPVFMKLGMYILAPESISTAYLINPSHQSLCLFVYTPIVARQRLGKNFTPATNTHATIHELTDA